MAYDESLAKKIDSLLTTKKGFTRKEMFGGVGYLFQGNMCIGIHNNDLIIRYDPELTNEIGRGQDTRPFNITGRPMKGWSLVNGTSIKGDQLKKWFDLSFNFVKSLPPKK